MQKEEKDLRDRTKAFALRIVGMFSTLPKTTEAQKSIQQSLDKIEWESSLKPCP